MMSGQKCGAGRRSLAIDDMPTECVIDLERPWQVRYVWRHRDGSERPYTYSHHATRGECEHAALVQNANHRVGSSQPWRLAVATYRHWPYERWLLLWLPD